MMLDDPWSGFLDQDITNDSGSVAFKSPWQADQGFYYTVILGLA